MPAKGRGDHALVTASAKAAMHAVYLKRFLADGFDALKHLQRLDTKVEHQARKHGEAEPRLAGLGAERSGLLLSACQAEPSLLNAIYWIVCGVHMLEVPLDSTVEKTTLNYIVACFTAEGGFSPHPDHPPNLLSTQSALQLMLLMESPPGMLEQAGTTSAASGPKPLKSVENYVRSLQLQDGSFCGRRAERQEGDCRFVYAALSCLVLLGVLRHGEGALPGCRETWLGQTGDWLLKCQNFDGGFGCRPGGECESHAGHTFCCLASLALIGGVDRIGRREHARLVRWLCDRQCKEGGLNGRPGKAPDACYTWWTLASAEILRIHHPASRGVGLAEFFDLKALQKFVMSCVSSKGGVSNHPNESPDPFHTFFGLAGLSMLQQSTADPATKTLGGEAWLAGKLGPRPLEGGLEPSQDGGYPLQDMSPVMALPTCIASRTLRM